ncbi:hypothetical protein GBA52_006132 [Prunus armeniaca]|nr:hypothetical protein GBA52_006132 [Prunus armeniaca]
MQAQKGIIPILIFILFLGIIQSCSCGRSISIISTNQASNGDTEQRLIHSRRYAPMFRSSIESMRKNKINAIHAVSHRVVYEGPNQLHN